MTEDLPPIDAERLWARVESLARFTSPEQPWTRRAFTPLFDESRQWLRREFERAGMSVHLDAGGNLVGRLEGREGAASAPPVVTGSHSDTVPWGGRFDGIAGVLAGIEVAHAFHESGVGPDGPIEVIDFLSEEPSDYGVSCIGSRAIAGQLTADMMSATNDRGETLAQGLERVGAAPAQLDRPLRAAGSVKAFVELHIEQGPLLELKKIPIGVVTDIVGIRRHSIVVRGQADHAGTTPMDVRCDALAGAAEIISLTQRHASSLSTGRSYVVATVGRLANLPNASNSVPGRVEMTLEARSNDATVLDMFARDVLAACAGRLAELKLTVEVTEISRSHPTRSNEQVMKIIEESARGLGYESMRMSSGAGHDAAYLASAGPMGMIFIPCLKGRSHCAEEWASPQQLAEGTRVLQHTMFKLAKSH